MIGVDWNQTARLLQELHEGVFQPGFRQALQRAAALCEVHARNRVELPAWPWSQVPRVCVESPLHGDYERNVLYADACLWDCLQRGEGPYLGHLLYPRVLQDEDPDQRAQGIAAHCAWLHTAQYVAVYIDLGITSGMRLAMGLAERLKLPVVERELGLGWMEQIPRRVRPTQGF